MKMLVMLLNILITLQYCIFVIHAYMYMHIHVWVHVCASIWKPEDNLGCHSEKGYPSSLR